MCLLLDFKDGAIYKGPLDNIGIWGSALDEVALLEFAPEGGKVLKLDEVPNRAEGSCDDSRFGDGGGGGDTGCHFEDCGFVVVFS